jgi:hypothetical protein
MPAMMAGALYYDADGSGAGQVVKFANIGTGLALMYLDFQIVWSEPNQS